MYTNILVPLDTSLAAEQVLSYLRQLATAETTIHLVSVIEPHMYTYALAAQETSVRNKLQAVVHSDMEVYLARIGDNLRQQGFTVETWLARGDAAQTIADVATKIDVDLIAMTTHGRTGFTRWALGSVADRIVQIAHQPIFLTRVQDQKPDRYELHRILIPLDGSTLAEAALQQAKVIAGEHRAQLIVTRVVEPLSSWQKAIIIEGGFNPDALEQERFEEAQQYLDRICTELGADHVAGIGRLFTGTASEAILHLLREEAVDLVVMSTHGLSGYSRWVYGSVAGKVLHSASCPLLLLRSVEVAKNAVPVSP